MAAENTAVVTAKKMAETGSINGLAAAKTMSLTAGSMVEQEAMRSARSLFSPGRVAAEKTTADVTDKKVMRENVHFAGEQVVAEATVREQRVRARSAVAAAMDVVVPAIPPSTDQEDARVARSLSVSAVEFTVPVASNMEVTNSAAAVDAAESMPLLSEQETFHASVPADGDFTLGLRVMGNLGVLTAEGAKIGRQCNGTVMYIGELPFEQSGEIWIGVCFDEVVGKHDGSVRGKSYFKCPDMCGRFVRPKNLRLLKEISVDTSRWSSHVGRVPGVDTVAGTREAQGALHAADQVASPAARLAAAIFENMESLGQNVATPAAVVNTVDAPGSVRMVQLPNASSMGEESFSVEEQQEIDVALKQYNSTVTVLSDMLLGAMTALEKRKNMGATAKQRVRDAVGKDLNNFTSISGVLFPSKSIIDLSNNNISVIAADMHLSWGSLSTLLMSGNPAVCSVQYNLLPAVFPCSNAAGNTSCSRVFCTCAYSYVGTDVCVPQKDAYIQLPSLLSA